MDAQRPESALEYEQRAVPKAEESSGSVYLPLRRVSFVLAIGSAAAANSWAGSTRQRWLPQEWPIFLFIAAVALLAWGFVGRRAWRRCRDPQVEAGGAVADLAVAMLSGCLLGWALLKAYWEWRR